MTQRLFVVYHFNMETNMNMDENDRIKTSHDYIVESMAGELEAISSSMAKAAEALGRLTRYYSNLKRCLSQEDEQRLGEYPTGCENGTNTRVRGTDDIPHTPEVAQRVSVTPDRNGFTNTKPLVGQVEPEDGKNITLKDVVREILARSKYDVDPATVKFRTVDDGYGTNMIEFRVEAGTAAGSSVLNVVERFTVYLRVDLNKTVSEFDAAIGNFHMIRVPLKSSDHADWDSIN